MKMQLALDLTSFKFQSASAANVLLILVCDKTSKLCCQCQHIG